MVDLTTTKADPFGETLIVGDQPVASEPAPTLGDYEIVEQIASGGMGVVYKARQRSLNRIVALKLIRSDALGHSTTEAVQRFRVEASAAARLDHPGIVSVYEVGEVTGQHFLSMAFVDGRSLNRELQAGPLDPRRAARLIRDVARAVQFANDRGIIHRDLKPHNVLLDSHGTPRVADFGLAKSLIDDAGLTTTGEIMGTPAYMSPEQATGGMVGAASDIYSLGATLYCCLTARPPFQAANAVETMRQVVEAEPASPRRINPSVPRDLAVVCLKCLRKDPVYRYATAGHLAADLDRWLANEPILARSVSLFERALLWCRRRPLVTALILLLLLSVGAGTVWAAERNLATRSVSLVQALITADIQQLSGILADIDELPQRAQRTVRDQFLILPDDTPAKRRLAVALAPRASEAAAYLNGRLADMPPDELKVALQRLEPQRVDVVALQGVVGNSSVPESRRLMAAFALAVVDGNDVARRSATPAFVAEAACRHLSRNPKDFDVVLEMMTPIRDPLLPHLARIAGSSEFSRSEQEWAFTTHLEFAQEDPALLVECLAQAEAWQYDRVLAKLSPHVQMVRPLLEAELNCAPAAGASEPDKERCALRQSNAAIALLSLGYSDAVWPLLRHRPDPRATTYIIHRVPLFHVAPRVLVKRLLLEPDASAKRALVLTLGGYDPNLLDEGLRHELHEQICELFLEHPDGGVHSTSEWLLRKWGQPIPPIPASSFPGTTADLERRWFQTSRGQTMLIVDRGQFLMGSPITEPDRDVDEVSYQCRVPRTFALAATEVTAAQFGEFLRCKQSTVSEPSAAAGDVPAQSVSWYAAAEYCNWLSSVEGIPEAQWPYIANKEGKFAEGMHVKAGHLKLTGYRLPTEAEWEFACRGGTLTRRYYGDDDELLPHYEWYSANAARRSHPVGLLMPNRHGLFDMLGNVAEWCDDRYFSHRAESANGHTESDDAAQQVLDDEARNLRMFAFVLDSPNLRCANRWQIQPSNAQHYVGFRIARTIGAASDIGVAADGAPEHQEHGP